MVLATRANVCDFDCLLSRFGLKEVTERISWAIREKTAQIRCDCKDAERVKNEIKSQKEFIAWRMRKQFERA